MIFTNYKKISTYEKLEINYFFFNFLGKTAAQVGHAALGVQRVLTIKSNKPGQMGQNKYKVSTTDLGLWQDFG